MPVCKERIKGITNTSTESGKPLNLQIFTTTHLLHTASYSSHLVILNYYFHPLLPFYLQNRPPTSQGLGKTGVQLLQPIYPRAGTAFAVLSRQVMCTEMLSKPARAQTHSTHTYRCNMHALCMATGTWGKGGCSSLHVQIRFTAMPLCDFSIT